MDAIGVKDFWRCISILLRNYHAVHKKIFACVVHEVLEVTKGLQKYKNDSPPKDDDVISRVCEEEELMDLLRDFEESRVGSEGFVVNLKMLTKREQEDILVQVIIDFQNFVSSFRISSTKFTNFDVKLDQGQISVDVEASTEETTMGDRWAQFVLKPKLLNWSRSDSEVGQGQGQGKTQIKSMQLIDIESYHKLYQALKKKYAETALQFWADAKESTDPLKFIYEDLAIAAYLITLWQREQEAEKPVVFADLGCGNGLLVYILCEEGFQGYGYDIRARKLWSLYPSTTRLIEMPIVPGSFAPPAEVNWLIGNHSDELSPWLPVLAATGSQDMRYFLLPCCAYEFSGVKFQRRNSRMSAYQDFYAYARDISLKCGFATMEDRLKIPSTKRLALLGMSRTHPPSEYPRMVEDIHALVASEQKLHPNATDQAVKLREKHELVRNCTQLDKDILASLIEKIFRLLLSIQEDREANDTLWQPGGELSMGDIAKSLSKTDLGHIKSECGGLKTLLRNRHEIFAFNGNTVGLRKPQKRLLNLKKQQTVRRRFCYFKRFHPDGCPLPDEDCTFMH